MGYEFWYDLAEYGSEAWRGFFSPREIATHAYEYKCEWNYALETHKVTETIKELLNNLREDKTEKAEEFIEVIETEIKYWKLKED